MDLNFHNMAQKTKAELVAEIDAIYVDCGTQCITPETVNAFEKDKVDSYAGQVIDITKAALIAAIADSEVEIGTRYRITDATGGVVWVWGVDANVISSNAVKEGTYDGSTLTAGSFGNYDLANDLFIYSGVLSFDVLLTNAQEIAACGSTPIPLISAPSGYKIQCLTVFIAVSGGTTDYDFIESTTICDSNLEPCMLIVSIDLTGVSLSPRAGLNAVGQNCFTPLSSFLYNGDSLHLYQNGGDATEGDRNVRVWGTYVLLPA